MGFTFERPVGAGADVLELEFVSTLMQTNVNQMREDGSIRAVDIAIFLSSRYGVQIKPEEVARRLLWDFSPSTSCGALKDVLDDDNNAEKTPTPKKVVDDKDNDAKFVLKRMRNINDNYLDLVEFVAVLLIPFLRRSNQDDQIGTILTMILDDAGLTTSSTSNTSNNATESSVGTNGNEAHNNDGNGDTAAAGPSDIGVELTVPVLQCLFRNLGEPMLANDECLLEEMIASVRGGCGANAKDIEDRPSTVAILNKASFFAALTHDLGAWNPEDCQQFRTTFEDVTEMTNNMRRSIAIARDNNNNNQNVTTTKEDQFVKNGQSDQDGILFQRTAPFVDLVADTFRSRSLVIFSWLFFGMSFFTYYSGIGTFLTLPACDAFVFRATWAANLGAFLCTVGWAVFRWVYIVVVMSAYGLAFFVLVCMGNSFDTKSPLSPLIGSIAATGFTVYPLYIPKFTRSDPVIDLLLKSITSLFGGIVAALNLWYAIVLLIPMTSALYQRYRSWWTPGAIKEEAWMKLAGRRKTDSLVANALDLHMTQDVNAAIGSHLGQVLVNYAYYGNTKSERVGGFVWTWKRIWNLELFKTEGFWYSGRLVSINVSQFFLSIFILAGGLIITVIVSQDYQPPSNPIEQLFGILFDLSPQLENLNQVVRQVSNSAANFVTDHTPTELFGCPDVQQELWANCTVDSWDVCEALGQDWLCSVVGYTKAAGKKAEWEVQSGLLARAGFTMDDVYNSSFVSLARQSREAVQTLYPTEKYMIFAPLLLGTIAAFLTALTISLTLVPSMTTTVLKLRCGVRDLMHDPKLKALRAAPDQVAFLRGAMFWGTIFSAGLMGVIIAVIVFLFVYQNTSSVAMHVLAMFIGILVVILVQFLLVRSCRFLTSQAFYRKRVLAANIILLMRECAYFALSIGFTIFRVAKLVVTTILFVGRVDTPFLAPGIGELEAFGFKLDNHPYVFLMDLLYHEAHRHPYIQIFGATCLLKLRLGENYISRAGSAWRLLLVLMLMPWLTRYRRLARGSTPPGMMEGILKKEGDDNLDDLMEMKEVTMEDMQRQIRTLKEQLYVSEMMRVGRRRSSDIHETIEL